MSPGELADALRHAARVIEARNLRVDRVSYDASTAPPLLHLDTLPNDATDVERPADWVAGPPRYRVVRARLDDFPIEVLELHPDDVFDYGAEF